VKDGKPFHVNSLQRLLPGSNALVSGLGFLVWIRRENVAGIANQVSFKIDFLLVFVRKGCEGVTRNPGIYRSSTVLLKW
jgi:hypothetical protein